MRRSRFDFCGEMPDQIKPAITALESILSEFAIGAGVGGEKFLRVVWIHWKRLNEIIVATARCDLKMQLPSQPVSRQFNGTFRAYLLG